MHDRYRFDPLKKRLLRAPPPAEETEEPPRAAVAIVLREVAPHVEAEILFIRRSERAGDPWSGHIAFPGGRHDPDDSSLLATAIRETREEIGLDLEERAELLARLPDMAARAKGKRLSFSIAPFVFALHEPNVELTLDRREVAEVIWSPLGALARGEGSSTYTIEVGGERYELPALQVGEHILWGLTHGMLETLVRALELED